MKVMSFDKTIAAAATAESINPPGDKIRSPRIRIKAKSTNSAACLIGDSSGQTYPLAAGAELILEDVNSRNSHADAYELNQIYVKVAVDGEIVHVMYLKETT